MEYEIKYSARKTVTLKVRDGRLYILAPIGTKSEYIEKLIEKHKHWILGKLDAQVKIGAVMAELSEEQIRELRREARKYFTERTAYYASVMGLNYGKIRISSAKGRFGSCNSSGNISYTYRLMLYPEAAREYVVVHELAHIRQMNHSKDFYAIVEAVMPDYKERRKLLKKID